MSKRKQKNKVFTKIITVSVIIFVVLIIILAAKHDWQLAGFDVSKESTTVEENHEEEITTSEKESTTTQEETVVQEAYVNIIDTYYTALAEQWNGEALVAAGLNFMVAFSHHGSPLEDIGFIITDINSDGVDELLIGSLVEDDFFGKMIFSLYTLDKENSAILIFESIERNRYYYVGENKFANLGASAFDTDFVTTVKFEDNEMIDMTYTTETEKYVQMEFTSFSLWIQ